MKKIVYVLAILAAASTGAVAKDLKQDKKAVPAVAATQMSDSEMDKVTAGAGAEPTAQGGLTTAGSVDANLGQSSLHVPEGKGLGTATTQGRP
jgi:hypothetical protein